MNKNYTKVPNKVFSLGLSPYSIAMYSFMVSLPEEFDPSVSYLAKTLRLSKSTIIRSTKELVDRNLIAVLDKGGLGKVTKYELQPPKNWKSVDIIETI